MNEWRISKYNPINRDRSGVYQIHEWTSVSDIGETFNGEVFTLEQYIAMESRYVSLALSFLQESQIPSLLVVGLEKGPSSSPQQGQLWLADLSLSISEIQERQRLMIQEIQVVCRLNLREVLWCRLEKENEFYIHFGYDYYMYIGSKKKCPKSLSYAHNIGLYLDDYPSPYTRIPHPAWI